MILRVDITSTAYLSYSKVVLVFVSVFHSSCSVNHPHITRTEYRELQLMAPTFSTVDSVLALVNSPAIRCALLEAHTRVPSTTYLRLADRACPSHRSIAGSTCSSSCLVSIASMTTITNTNEQRYPARTCWLCFNGNQHDSPTMPSLTVEVHEHMAQRAPRVRREKLCSRLNFYFYFFHTARDLVRHYLCRFDLCYGFRSRSIMFFRFFFRAPTHCVLQKACIGI